MPARPIQKLLALLLLAAPLPALAAGTAAERTQAFIEAFQKVEPAADKAVYERASAVLDGFFDFDTLTAEPIAPRAGQLTAAQKVEFSTRFRSLIRQVAYPDSGAFFRKAKLKIGAATTSGGDELVAVDAQVASDDLRVVMELRWRRVGGTLRIVDVAFDGDSLVKDYQSQFARIIDKDGGAGLLQKLAAREAALAKQAAKP